MHYQDRITYLDEIQYESNQRPGIGNYNPRVLFGLFRIGSKLNIRNWKPSQNSGERSMSCNPRKNRRRHRTPGHTIRLPAISLYFKIYLKWSITKISWEGWTGSRRSLRVLVSIQRNTTWSSNGEERRVKRWIGTACRSFPVSPSTRACITTDRSVFR